MTYAVNRPTQDVASRAVKSAQSRRAGKVNSLEAEEATVVYQSTRSPRFGLAYREHDRVTDKHGAASASTLLANDARGLLHRPTAALHPAGIAGQDIERPLEPQMVARRVLDRVRFPP